MKKERFEELVEIACRATFGEFWSFLDIELVRDALAAVYPLIRDDVIEKCASAAKSQNRRSNHDPVWLGVLESCKIIRALKSKDTKL